MMDFAQLKLDVAKQTSVTASLAVLFRGLLDWHADETVAASTITDALGNKELSDAVVANTPVAVESATLAPPATAPIEPINVTKVADNTSGEQAPMHQQPSTEAETPASPMNPAYPANDDPSVGEHPNVTE